MAGRNKNHEEGIGCLVLMGIIGLIALYNYVTTHSWTWFVLAGGIGLIAWGAKVTYDKGADLRRHKPAIMLLKFFAYSDNKLSKVEFDIIEAYLHTIDHYDPASSPAGPIIKGDFPKLADLERYVLLTRNALDGHETEVLLDHVDMLRRTRKTHSPIAQEWYDSVSKRLREPKRERTIVSAFTSAEAAPMPDPTLRPGIGAELIRRRVDAEKVTISTPRSMPQHESTEPIRTSETAIEIDGVAGRMSRSVRIAVAYSLLFLTGMAGGHRYFLRRFKTAAAMSVGFILMMILATVNSEVLGPIIMTPVLLLWLADLICIPFLASNMPGINVAAIPTVGPERIEDEDGDLDRVRSTLSRVGALTRHEGARSTVHSLAARIDSLEGVEFDEDIERQLHTLVCDDLPKLITDWAKIRPIASEAKASIIDGQIADGMRRVEARMIELADQQVSRGSDTISMRNSYMRTKHPLPSDDPLGSQV